MQFIHNCNMINLLFYDNCFKNHYKNNFFIINRIKTKNIFGFCVLLD